MEFLESLGLGNELATIVVGVGVALLLTSISIAMALRARSARAEAALMERALAKERERCGVLERELRVERSRPAATAPSRRETLARMPRALRELSRASSRRELAELLGRAVTRLLDPGQWMVFLETERSGNEFVLVSVGSTSGPTWPVGAHLTEQMGRTGLVIRRRTAMDRQEFDAEPPLVRNQLKSSEPRDFRIDVAAPVVVNDTTVAVVTVGVPNLPLEATRSVLELLTEYAAAVVRRLDARELAVRLENCDELTGLNNRSWFNAQAAELLFQMRDTEQPIATILFSVDDLRGYSGRQGPAEAGRLLHGIAQGTAPLLRDSDLLARWGDDAFVLMLPGIDHRAGREVVDRLRRRISADDWPGAGEQPGGAVTISAGIAVSPENGAQLDELLASASRSLSRSRRLGGDHATGEVVMNPAEVLAEARITQELQHAEALHRADDAAVTATEWSGSDADYDDLTFDGEISGPVEEQLTGLPPQPPLY